jgi:hypothetical protein
LAASATRRVRHGRIVIVLVVIIVSAASVCCQGDCRSSLGSWLRRPSHRQSSREIERIYPMILHEQ